MGPHSCGVRGLAQARLQALGLGNPDWVLFYLLWSLLGTPSPPPHTHTQRQVPQADPDMPLPFRAQMGTEAQSGGQTPRATISKPRDPRCPSEETSAPPLLPLPTGSTENK